MKAWLVVISIYVILISNTVQAGSSIHRMMVGDKVLQLEDTTRLTSAADGEVDGAWISPDGKYVAYSTICVEGNSVSVKVCIIGAAGGRSTILLASPKVFSTDSQVEMPVDFWIPDLDESKQVVWSPDSKSVAFYAEHSYRDSTKESTLSDFCIVVTTTAGQRRAVFTLPRESYPSGGMVWSLDSRKLACGATSLRTGADGKRVVFAELFVLDIAMGSVETILSVPKSFISLDRWNPDGKSILHYDGSHEGPFQQRETFLNHDTKDIGDPVTAMPKKSPDGRMTIKKDTGLSVEDLVTGEIREVFKDYKADTIGWTPDSRMIVYKASQAIKDAPGDRNRELNTIWLAVPEKQKMNHMCVALDGYVGKNNVFSNDSLRMAYVLDGDAYLALLKWYQLDTSEKLAAGIPLSETEEQNMLMNNAKIIGTGLAMYAGDWDDKYPTGDQFMTQLEPYLQGKQGLFNRPGTNQMAFQYFPPGDFNSIENHAETMMGMFDIGYSWQVVLYADGHVKVVPKQ